MSLSIWKIECPKTNGNTTHFFAIYCAAKKFIEDGRKYCGTILQSDSERLVEDAYRIGLEVRTAQELLDPSTLITEPGTIRSQADVLCYNPSSEPQIALDINPSFECAEKEPQDALQLSHSQLVTDDGLGITVSNGNLDRNSHTPQCDMSFEQWDTDNCWDGYDLTHENPILGFNPEMNVLGCDSMRNVQS
ncbi:hypothetical protein DL98DRAFT_593425 [Cadophora sp. DSE1049]|nr:hypothetical protein DL98DRAFT_593425 [Cadophora sp. DSE1049]